MGVEVPKADGETTDIVSSPDTDFDTQDKDPKEFCSRWARSLRITMGARFEAENRLRQKKEHSLLALSLLSIYVIAGTLAPQLISNIEPTTVKYLNLSTVMTSIFILVLSLIEGGKGYAIRAERMGRCAQALSELYHDLEIKLNMSQVGPDMLTEFKQEYDKILRDFPENHSDLDFNYYRVTHPRRFRSSYKISIWKKIPDVIYWRGKHFVNTWLFYLVLIALPPLIAMWGGMR